MIKVMKNAQKIIRRDPDLMTVMQININDSDITSHATDNKKKEEKKDEVKEETKELNDMIKVMRNAQKIIRRDPDLMTVMQININDSDITSNKETKPKEEKKDDKAKGKKQNFGNLFG